MYSEFKNKYVVITGAGMGIGKHIAQSFLKQGAKTILISRSKILWLDEFNKDQYITIEKDIQDISFFQSWLEDFEEQGNCIDILINNAGVNNAQRLLEVSENEWDSLININAKATFFLTKIFAQHMKNNNFGNIIFASSFATNMPSFSHGIYAASKAMVLSLSKSFAAELAPHNIRVNSFSPGVIDTSMTKAVREKNKENMLNDISLKRFGKTEEIANVVLFLASKESSYIHGADIDISGGKFIIQNPSSAHE
jgi:NAD(P)-dependent dehydrogenase (short-subunit alcohol dehydrogenase family)